MTEHVSRCDTLRSLGLLTTRPNDAGLCRVCEEFTNHEARVRADERDKAAGRVEAAEICTCDPRWDGFNKGQHRDWCVRMVTLAAIREATA